MAFDWREYLRFARLLHLERRAWSEEAGWRTAVSRAYYAAFCHLRNDAAAHGGFVPRRDPGDHGRLQAHLRDVGHEAAAQQLGSLRVWRNQCDYDDEVERLELMVVAATATAGELVGRFGRCQRRFDPPRGAVGS
jgi:hypothetical protein